MFRVKPGECAGDLAAAGQELEDVLHAAEFADLAELGKEVVVVELVRPEFLLEFFRLFLVDFGGGLFHEGDDVSHAEDAPGHPFGIKHFKAVELFTETDEFDRPPGHFADGERGTAAGVTVEFGQDETGEIESLMEVFRH